MPSTMPQADRHLRAFAKTLMALCVFTLGLIYPFLYVVYGVVAVTWGLHFLFLEE